MNPIQELFDKMTDEEVRQGILEIKQSDIDGIIPDGIVRKYARELKNETNGASLDLFHSMVAILKQGAYRWAEGDKKFLILSGEGDKKFLILSGEGGWETENQFVMECPTRDEAIEQFNTFKNGTYKDTYLMVYEGKLIHE
jgi:hypothetical protein